MRTLICVICFFVLGGSFAYADAYTAQERILSEDRSSWEIAYYRDDALVAKQSHYADGSFIWEGEKITGKVTVYYGDGQIMKVLTYADGQLEGEGAYYFHTGKLYRKVFYIRNDLHGQVQEFSANGDLKLKQHWKNGVLDGEQILYDMQGEIKEKSQWRDGILVSVTSYEKI